MLQSKNRDSDRKSHSALRGPPENWISAAANQPCNTACSNAGFDECGQEEMAAINSTATLSTLLSLLNLTSPHQRLAAPSGMAAAVPSLRRVEAVTTGTPQNRRPAWTAQLYNSHRDSPCVTVKIRPEAGLRSQRQSFANNRRRPEQRHTSNATRIVRCWTRRGVSEFA